MKITLSQYAGFCDGVDRAYKIVEKASKNKKTKKPIYMLGSLVHNEDVVKKIEKMGVKKLVFEGSVKKTLKGVKGKIGTIIVTAHGFGPALYNYANKNGIEIIDTTCPRVIKVQRLAKIFSDRGSQLVILGEKKHKEVKGIFEWANKKGKIIGDDLDLKKLKLDSKKEVVLISQTTQNEKLFKKIADGLTKKKYPIRTRIEASKLQIFNTICNTTHKRQEETRKMAEVNDVMVVIGSTRSSNSNRLNEISCELNSQTYFIADEKNIRKNWFKNCKKVGVMAGASTPKWVIQNVLKKIESFK